MADQPTEQLSLEQILKQQIQHPDFTNVQPGAVSTRNPDGYNPANVGDSAVPYVQKWNEQFGSQPAAEQPPAQAQEPTPPAPPAGPQEPQVPRDDKGRYTKLYAGRYRSPEDLESAYLNQFQETQRIIAERDAIKAAQVMLNQQPFRSREPERPSPIRVSVPQEGEPFVDPSQLDSYVEQRARQVASQQIQEVLGPILQSSKALNNVRATYSDYQQNEADFSKWLTVNPELAGRIHENPEMGTEYAYLKFLRERGQVMSAQAQAQAAQSQPQLDQARQHAARPNAGRNEVNENQSRSAHLAELYKYGQETGDWRPYQRFRIGEVVPGWHTNTDWGK